MQIGYGDFVFWCEIKKLRKSKRAYNIVWYDFACN